MTTPRSERLEAAKRRRQELVFPGLARLPAPLGYRIASCLGRRQWLPDDPRWRDYSRGMSLAYPGMDLHTLSRLAQWHAGMLGREMNDVFVLPRLTSGNFSRFISLSGLQHLREAQTSGNGVILCMAHYGRPIMLSTALGLSQAPVGMLTQRIDERNPFLTPADRDYLRIKMRNTLDAAGGRWITQGDNLREIYAGLREGETIIIMMDLYEPDPARRVAASFLGHSLALPDGIVRIAARSGARLVYGVARDAGWRAEVELRPLPGNDPEAAFAGAVAELEKDVRLHPAQWWQWNLLSLLRVSAVPMSQ